MPATLDEWNHDNHGFSQQGPGLWCGCNNRYTAETCYKTVNIYSLSDSSWRNVIERLELYISSGKVNEYYEVVFKTMIADGSLSMNGVFFDPECWYEIDTPVDLANAERILEETDTYPEAF